MSSGEEHPSRSVRAPDSSPAIPAFRGPRIWGGEGLPHRLPSVVHQTPQFSVTHFRTTLENEGLAEQCSVNGGSAKRIGIVGRIPTNFLVDAARKVGTLLLVMSLTTSRSAAPVASATASARASEVVVVLALIVVLLVIGPAGTGTL